MEISASGSQHFELRLGLTTLASLVLRLSHLDYNCTTHFHRFLAYRGQIMGLLSFHNLMNQSLITNLFIYLPTYLSPTGSITLENPDCGGWWFTC